MDELGDWRLEIGRMAGHIVVIEVWYMHVWMSSDRLAMGGGK
jgi:hypothetical protein